MATGKQMNRLLNHVTVTRDDQVYEAFPDICLLQNGKILCVYHHRELHDRGNEELWWEDNNIAPLIEAERLWRENHKMDKTG